MPLTVATWNINSVRLRQDLVAELAAKRNPDVICLQETKCPNSEFPRKSFERLGYRHIAAHGQKGYHGVAVLSKRPIETIVAREFCEKGDCRHLAVDVEGDGGRSVRIHNFYVPAGGDEPDPAINPKFAHKLDFLEELIAWSADDVSTVAPDSGALLLGDLNIAPLEDDVWSHRQLLRVVSHTPVETEGLERVRKALDWVDVVRRDVPPPEKLYTWWSYRARDWEAADKGRRLDHVWLTPGIADACTQVEVLREARGWERPSDHVPVIVRLEM
ncbi:exodeoxyribonuclease III [Microbaculum marinum]|uniref:Exodeoxyribonuclease III n=1 Tax=Microbaculum marinum TaxID=1764581 RepID=A0AAW9S5T6_9HYPH